MESGSQGKKRIVWLMLLWLGGGFGILEVSSAPFPVNLILVALGAFLVLSLTVFLLRKPDQRTARTGSFETLPGPSPRLSPRLSPRPQKVEERKKAVLDKKAASPQLPGIPQEAADIIRAYSGVLLELARENAKLKPEERKLLRPVSKLPYAKEKIEEVIETALGISKNEDFRKQLDGLLLELDNFAADEEVPNDPEENQLAWIRRLTVKGQKNVKSTA